MSGASVSVVIPTYNRAALLCEAVDSVLRQTYRDIEIIVVDDGSTDGTEAAMRRYDGRVRYLKQLNQGVNAARNLGVAHAGGKYLALLDNDDLWAPYKIELQVALLEQFPALGFVFSNFYIFTGPQPQIGVNTKADGLGTWFEHVPERIEPFVQRQQFAELGLPQLTGLPRHAFAVCSGDIYASSLCCPYVLPSTALIRREMLTADLRLPEHDSTCGDWEFFARLSRRHGALYVDLETTFNRSHEDAVRLTRVDGSVQLARRIAMVDRVWRADAEFMARHGARVDAVQRELLLQLARLHLLAARGSDARMSLQRAASMAGNSRSTGELVLNVLARIPGSGTALQALRSTLHGARRLLSVAAGGR